MKPFKINRNSWHYKLNKYFFNEYGITDYRMQECWEPRRNDFCSYWRVTIFRLILAAFIAFFLCACLFGIGFAMYLHPYETLEVVGTAIAFLGLVIACVAAIIYFDKSKKKMEQSLFVQKYKVHKSKVCPMVEYE